MSDSGVLLASSLHQIYTQPSVPSQCARWTKLVDSFQETYSHPPLFVARAPGRVNIIGEHIDYCGFSVLPAAIEPDLLIAVSASYHTHAGPADDQPIHVRAINLDPAYPETVFSYSRSTRIKIGGGGWSDYLKSAVNTAVAQLHSSSIELRQPSSIKLLVHGTVPAGSGLSSSAALTTAAVLAVLYVHHQPIWPTMPKSVVAALAVATEQGCGVSVGGMDQTASVFGQPAKVLHIEFTPTTTVVPLNLPGVPATTFVIANSLVRSTKLDAAKEQYNLRVVECRIAARLLSARLLGQSAEPCGTLRELVERVAPGLPVSEGIQHVLGELESTDALGGPAGLPLEAILDGLNMGQAEFEADVVCGMEVEPRGGMFKPFSRARHVLTEAERVYKFRALLEEARGMEETQGLVCQMGALMRESQTSCAHEYECSCEALDELVTIAAAHGSLGSRLTGAGWGGSSVHMVRDEHVDQLIAGLRKNYYGTRFPGLSEKELSDACFATKPEGGACVFIRPESLAAKAG